MSYINIVYPRGSIDNSEYVTLEPKQLVYEGEIDKIITFTFDIPANTIYITNAVTINDIFNVNVPSYLYLQPVMYLRSIRAYSSEKGYILIVPYYNYSTVAFSTLPVLMVNGYGENHSDVGYPMSDIFFVIYNNYNHPISVTVYVEVLLALGSFNPLLKNPVIH